MSKTPEISKIAIYETEDGQTKLHVKIEGELNEDAVCR